jgi:DHA3 family tetracycline resistance protein-like MFS transporter
VIAEGPLPPLLRPLRSRAFAALWLGQAVSFLGDAIYQLALPWTVLALTGSAAAVGLVLAAESLPQVALVLAGGVLADRLGRRRVLIAANVAGAAVTGAVAAVAIAGRLTLGELVGAATLVGAVAAFVLPAYRPLCTEVLDREALQPANALQDGVAAVTRIGGPPLGGLIYAVSGIAGAFAANAVSFAVAALSILPAPARSGGPAESRAPVWREAGVGVGYVSRTGWLRSLIALSLATNVTALAAFIVLLPVAVRARGLPIGALGLAALLQGAGGLAGSLLLGNLGLRGRRGTAYCLVVALIGVGAALLAVAGPPLGPGLAAAVFGLGTSAGVLEHTLLQEHVPRELLSRVYSLDMLGSIALLPPAYAAAGLLASALGPFPVLLAAGSLQAALALLVLTAGPARRLA